MRVRQSIMVVILLAGGLAAAAGSARAAAVADLNSFSGAAVTTSDAFGGFAPASALVDGLDNVGLPYIFSDYSTAAQHYVNISGMRGGSFDTLRIFDNAWAGRTATSATVYYSSVNTTSVNPGDYTSLGTTSLSFTNTSTNPLEKDSNGNTIKYAQINAAIPAGTQSILLGLSGSLWVPGQYPGASVAEVQGYGGIGDANLLSGRPVATSTLYNNGGLSWITRANVTDGTANTFVFEDWDTQRAMAITGFTSNVSLIRIWKGGDRIPSTVDIYSTTAPNSTNVGDYTPLTNVPTIVWNAAGYMDIAVNAPAGTQGLGFVWGPGNNANGAQITEVQAFAAIPEPSTLVILVCGLIGLLAYAWRKRR